MSVSAVWTWTQLMQKGRATGSESMATRLAASWAAGQWVYEDDGFDGWTPCSDAAGSSRMRKFGWNELTEEDVEEWSDVQRFVESRNDRRQRAG